MNNHFRDSRYYLKRAAEHARLGVIETINPIVGRVRSKLGIEPPEPEPSRLETVRDGVSDLETRASQRVHSAAGVTRERVGAFRADR